MSIPESRHGSLLTALEGRLRPTTGGAGDMSSPRTRAWPAFLVAAVGAIVGYLFLPSAAIRGIVYETFGLVAFGAIILGVRINRPVDVRPWVLFAIGQVAWVVAEARYDYRDLALNETSYPSAADVLYLLSHLPWLAGLFLLIRRRGSGRDRAGLIDATIIATAWGLVSWIILMEPNANDPSLPPIDRVITIAHPLMDVIMVGVAVRLIVGPGRRSPAFWFLVASLGSTLAAEAGRAYLRIVGGDWPLGLFDPVWLLGSALWAAAALHPSMRTLAEPGPEQTARLTVRRGALLSVALLVAPAALTIEYLRDDIQLDVPPIAAGMVVLSFLVLARMAGLVTDLRATISEREAAMAELKAADAALRSSERRFRRLVEHAADAVFLHEASGQIVDVNERACDVLGYGRDELLAMHIADIEVDFDAERWRALWTSMVPHVPVTLDGMHRRKDGHVFPVEIRVGLFESAGRPLLLALARDVTERRALEEQLRQSQKMEAVGQLAGGIAHDFNNLLTVITGYSELLLETLDPNDRLAADVGEIKRAADRAGGLTRQLLAYSRKQVLQMEVLDLNAIVTGIEPFLARLIGEHISVYTRLQPGLRMVEADRIQLEQVLLNLAVNGRDAMPDGGTLSIETSDIELDDAYVRIHADATAGPHVRLVVRDTGVGMSEEVQARLFLPFFTTKETGRGTGLGLATVYGVVRQIGGHITVRSTLGRGSTFSIYLPRARAQPVPVVRPNAERRSAMGSETLLVVEDEPAVRALLRGLLERHGYRVLEAQHGEAALKVASEHRGRIDLLVTDVVMPGMNGRVLAETLTRSRPGLPVLFISGYTDDVIGPHGILEPGITLLEKPFTAESLTRRIRDVLDARAA